MKHNPYLIAFHKAAELLEEKGWCQGVAKSIGGKLCIMQAVQDACSFPCDTLVAWAKLEKRLNCSPVYWNDTPGRTREEVTKVLRSIV